MVQHRFPITIVASTGKIDFFVYGNFMVSLAISRDRELQIMDILREECEHTKAFNRGWKPVDERVTGIAGGAMRVFLGLAAVCAW